MNKPKVLIPSLLVGVCLTSEMQAGIISYQISNAGGASTESGYADLQEVNISIDGAPINNAFAGGIQITETAQTGATSPPMPTQYTTLCTDVSGTLYIGNTYTYQTPITPFGNLTGVDPTWGALNGPNMNIDNAGNASQAIQNAAYLFYTFGNLNQYGITGTPDQMAGLQLAVWEALYDTIGSGQVVANEGTTSTSSFARFQVLAGGDANAIAYANSYLATLNDQLNAGNFGYAGFLLSPDPATDQNGGNINYGNTEPPQELLIACVPEPSTIMAGLAVLLPSGASTLMALRKNLKA